MIQGWMEIKIHTSITVYPPIDLSKARVEIKIFALALGNRNESTNLSRVLFIKVLTFCK
jgi:hypothetical protein